MTEKKKAPVLNQGATQKISKDELEELLKKAEAEDPENEVDAEADTEKKPAKK